MGPQYDDEYMMMADPGYVKGRGKIQKGGQVADITRK